MHLPASPKDILRQFISAHSARFGAGSFGRGALLNVASAFAFYLATVFVHQERRVPPELFALVRYAGGGALFSLILLRNWSRNGRNNPHNWNVRGHAGVHESRVNRERALFIVLRSIFNVIAILCFYKAVSLGDTGTANVLNMTYPAFVAVIAGPMIGEFPRSRTLLLLGLALTGTFLSSWGSLNPGPGVAATASPEFEAILWGLASGITAALAVVSLRGAARFTGTSEILFWMFILGTGVLLPLFGNRLSDVPQGAWMAVGASAALGVAGQWLLTSSYRYVDATAGSILSSARIPIAIAFGFAVLAEPFSPVGWAGAGLVFLCNVLLAFGGNNRQDVPESADGARKHHR